MSFDPFALEEGGGGIEAFTGIVTDAYWQEGDYGVSLLLKSTFDNPELFPAKEDGTYTQFYAAGKGWSTGDAGETVTHEGGPDKNFRKDSGVGVLIGAIASIDGIRDSLPSDFDTRRAASYKGLHLEWGRVPVSKRKPKVDEDGNRVQDTQGKDIWVEVEVNQLLPVGIVGGTTSSNGSGSVDVTTLGLDMADQVTLSELAKTLEDGPFMVEVAKGYSGNSALMTALTKDTAGTKKALAESII